MSEEKKTGLQSLTKTFLKVAGIGLSIAFGFYIMGTLDFIMFHELAEGQAFLERAGPAAAEFLRADIPLVGFSIADTFTAIASWFPAPGVDAVANSAAEASLDLADGW